MLLGGLNTADAWSRVLVYTKSLFEDFKTVRQVSAVNTASSMIWGSFLATDLLREYAYLHFIQHPQVSSILALASVQREGKALDEALSAMSAKTNKLVA